MIFLLTRSSSFVDRVFIILRSRLLTEPRILVRIWHHPGRPLGWCRWRGRHFRLGEPEWTGHWHQEPHPRQNLVYRILL